MISISGDEADLFSEIAKTFLLQNLESLGPYVPERCLAGNFRAFAGNPQPVVSA